MIKIGDRVGAYISNRDGAVEFLGYGVISDFDIPRDGVGYVCNAFIRENRKDAIILLDTGDVVCGCECFWSTEDAVKKTLDGQQIEVVYISDIRKRKREKIMGGESADTIKNSQTPHSRRRPKQVEMFR